MPNGEAGVDLMALRRSLLMNCVVVTVLSVLLAVLTLESSAAAESAWVLWAE